jgi:small-conductance mechanosensitive channel
MSVLHKTALAVLTALLLLAGVAYWHTAPPTAKAVRKALAAHAAAQIVDDTPYTTAASLALLPAAAEEQPFAQAALRTADHELDLAFTAALIDVEAHPPTLDAAAESVLQRIHKFQSLADAHEQRIGDLKTAIGQAKAAQREELQDEIDLVQSLAELDKDELEEANQDLIDAGGNPRQRIEGMIETHAARTKAQASATLKPLPAQPAGAIGSFRAWWSLQQKRSMTAEAREAAAQGAEGLAAQRANLAAALDSTKGGISELAQHTKAAPAAPPPGTAAPRSHSDSTTLVSQTKSVASDQRVLTLTDRRIAAQRELTVIYDGWSTQLGEQASRLVHALLFSALIVIVVLLLLLLADRWLMHLLNNPKFDRRQVETLRSITRMALRVVAVLVILLVAIGIPSQFGTMIGIVGAGLTVALKDFIVAFFGWLVLMGRNGIRVGDWVEINGVSGEVTELGMFHTVLLETGNWSDSGHPTGRRVTFTNSFAIEKHYFNFSTSGQWLWDELQVVIPTGLDPYPIVDALMQEVGKVTADSAREAEKEWNRSVPASRGKTFTAVPGMNLKPVFGGIEVGIRYITQANERSVARAKLYHLAVDLIGQKTGARHTGGPASDRPADAASVPTR